MSIEQTLEGRVAIITGGARGLGAAIGVRLAEAGARLVLADLDQEQLTNTTAALQAQGHTVQALQTNVTQESEVGNLVVLAQTRFERIDIMVNCAGILRSTRIQAISKAEWDLVLDVNLNGTFLCTQAVLGTMKARGYGRIVNLASLAGRSVSTLGGAHYTASKAGVIGLTRAVAKEMGPFGITVNAICPGVVDTDMPNNIASSDQLAAVAASLPIPRMGTAEEIADLAYFIIAKAPYINGAAIDINGGGLMI